MRALILLSFLSISSFAASYQYDGLGRLIQTTYDNGTSITYTYNAAGNRLSQTGGSNASSIFSFTSGNNADFLRGQSGSYTLTIAGASSATYTSTNLPYWLKLSNGVISGTPQTPGLYVFNISAVSGSTTLTQNFLLSVSNTHRLSQTIYPFAPISNAPFGSLFTLTNSNSSAGLPVSFAVKSGPAAVSGTSLRIMGVGTVTLTASQAGNTNFTPAIPLTNTFTTVKASQSIPAFPSTNNLPYGTVLTLTNSNCSAGLPVSFAVLSGPGALSNNALKINGVGTVTLTASQAGNSNYLAAQSITNTYTTVKANQTITFTLPATNTFSSNGLIPLSGNASSGLPITYTSSSNSVLTISTNNAVMKAKGTITVTASQSGNGNYNAATNIVRTITLK
jgi:YD repeat-containing protein